ncbi:MAG: DUF1622 domain-containing protein [Limnochordia bacterium]
MDLLNQIELGVGQLIRLLAVFLESMGAFVIVSVALAIFRHFLLKQQESNTEIRIQLARGLALGLEFKLGAEILRTVTVRTLDEIVIVAVIIILRALLTLLIHWEIDHEERAKREKMEETH